MKVQIGNLKKEGKNLELVLSFEGYENRDRLEHFVDYLFKESVNSVLYDSMERGGRNKKEVSFWGRSKRSLSDRISGVARYNEDDVKVKLVMKKEDMLTYLDRLQNTKGVTVEQNYKSLLSQFDC